MKINPNGYSENNTSEGHAHDEVLCRKIIEFFNSGEVKSVVDIGCGDAWYTTQLHNAGFHTLGLDGNPNLSLPDYCRVIDLTGDLGRDWEFWKTFPHFQWGICLEVGEHIPEKFFYKFLRNLDSLCNKGIILSWALPGQGGDGHVNCRSNDYIRGAMKMLGFESDYEVEKVLRESTNPYPIPCYWFKDTLMVFRRG